MMKNFRKIAADESGFTLTEVLVGIMILTVAIVTATNLLIGLIGSNRNNVNTLKAYYMAQEGIEAVRNIRDTNWLHNRLWLGDPNDNPWGEIFKVEGTYRVDSKEAVPYRDEEIGSAEELKPYASWTIENISSQVQLTEEPQRLITINECADFDRDICVVVESKVVWSDGGKEREVVLEEVLTDWKGGAL